jgi:RNA polymerase sigma factor (TIGR02999 family)
MTLASIPLLSVSPQLDDLNGSADAGASEAPPALFVALYRELHSVAERQLRRVGPDLTLGTTTLLHEAYLKLDGHESLRFENHGHFLAYAARAMRCLIIDYARQRRAKKRGGEFHIASWAMDEAGPEAAGSSESLEPLSAALDTLAHVEPELAQLVDLHFFCGFSFIELAELRGVSERTVQRDWRRARLLLHRVLQET